MTLRLLTIAGSDSGGGAGIQADLKTFAAHGAYGMSVVTAVTAQNTREVRAIAEVPVDVVSAQIDAVFEDIGVDAVKIGMLASEELVQAVAKALRRHQPRHVVLDPVMVAKSGDSLLAEDAVRALVQDLLPLASILTPNLPEARTLTGLELATASDVEASRDHSLEERKSAARLVAAMAAQDPPAVLLKGGHAPGPTVIDVLFDEGEFHHFEQERLETPHTHGTGCTLSSAIAARLARGEAMPVAVQGAIRYLHGAIAAAPGLGGGHGPVDHLYRLFPQEGREDPRPL